MSEDVYANFHKKFTECTHLVVFTGAGASAGSGIPTFRGGPSSWWESFFGALAFPILATGWGWQHIPTLSWFIYDWFMRGRVLRAVPNAFHRWVRSFQDDPTHHVTVITQNVDGLHQKSLISKQNVFELHGTLWNSACSNIECGELYSRLEPRIILPHESVPTVENCPRCGSGPRPGALLFSDRYFKHHHETRCDFSNLRGSKTVILVVGLSGAVRSADYYLNRLIEQCGMDGIFVIDPGESDYTKGYSWIQCNAEDFPDNYELYKALLPLEQE